MSKKKSKKKKVDLVGRDPLMGKPCCRNSVHETKKDTLQRRNSKESKRFWREETDREISDGK